MALVTTIEPSGRNTLTVHRPTRCTHSTLLSPDGIKILQLDTYGSNEREFPDKVSQTLQFNEDSAAQLIQLLMNAFPAVAQRWRKV